MAKRNSTSKIDSVRKERSQASTRPKRAPQSPNSGGADPAESNPFEDFGGERAGLMKAEAVLHCLTVSLNYSSWYPVDGTAYATAVDIARDLVRESMERLERRDRLIAASKPRAD